jgi:hypothetical protein
MVNKVASACLATIFIAVLGLTTVSQMWAQWKEPGQPGYRYLGKDFKFHEGVPLGKPAKKGYTRHYGEWVKQPQTKAECKRRGKIDYGPDEDAPSWTWKNGKCLSECPEGECG